MLQDRLNKIKEYFIGMEMYNGQWVVRVKYRPKWGAYPPEDGRVKVVADENENDLWWYCANDESVDIDSIIDLIEETIETNLEAIKKVELFKLKASELKQIFSDESITLSRLQSLRFVFDENNSKPNVTQQERKKKVSSKKELINQVDDAIKEHDVFTSKTAITDDNTPKRETQKRGGRKKTTIIGDEDAEATTPLQMTQEEIDNLRG